MTKEELEKEAYKEAEKLKEYQTKPNNEYEKGFNNGEVRGYKDGYRDGAEPREKRIAELEQKLEQTEKDLADYQFNYPTIKELQKENAELKKKNLDTQDAVTMQMYTNKANKEIADKQLTNAKEIIKSFITLLTKSRTALDTKTCLTKAEQFLNEVKK